MSEKPETLTKTALAEVRVESTGGGAMLVPQTMTDVVNFSQIMARGGIAIPKHLRDSPGACLAVCMQAFRWEMDPFAVANKSFSVNDKLGYEAQLVAAVVHVRAPIIGRPEYVYSGEPGSTRQCTVRCTMNDGSTREYTSPPVNRIPTKNSPLWKSDEDQQLGYFSIRSWARRYAPEVILGVYTADELAEFRDITPRKAGIVERLQAAPQPATDKGFSRENVEREIGGDPVIVEAEVVEVHAAAEPDGPEPSDDDFPGDRPTEASVWADMDWEKWVEGQKSAADTFKTKTQAELRDWWTIVIADDAYKHLQQANEGLALSLKAHVVRIDKSF